MINLYIIEVKGKKSKTIEEFKNLGIEELIETKRGKKPEKKKTYLRFWIYELRLKNLIIEGLRD